jgi:catechol 2,3-dioxygenase-like lactoylglutathione lyase family enzyme
VALPIEGVDHVALVVRDQARSVAWYEDLLGLYEVFADVWDGVPRMLVAPVSRTGVALFQAKDPDAAGVAAGTIRIAHVAFRVDRATFDAAEAALEERGIEFEFQDHEVSRSIYFQDPDGHELELTTYGI